MACYEEALMLVTETWRRCVRSEKNRRKFKGTLPFQEEEIEAILKTI